ncbi:MAG TPA: lysine biosynthesis protein LysW [Bacteroidaceae bacterium]|nr:lysine biosynthesis protein LysW [Bacteroidaceae bacterium]
MSQLYAECPICYADVLFVDDIVCGELIVCPECGMELEVISISPITLNEAPQEAEDWGQ